MEEHWKSDGTLSHNQHLLRELAAYLQMAADDMDGSELSTSELDAITRQVDQVTDAVSGLVEINVNRPTLHVLMNRNQPS